MKRLFVVCGVCLAGACSSGSSTGGGTGGMAGGTTPMAGQTGSGGGTTAGPAHFFPAGSVWTKDVSAAAKDPQSDAIVAWLDGQGFGAGRFQIDFGIDLLRADANTPKRKFTPTGDFFEPDCDNVTMPVPVGGNVESNPGYACDDNGDCHLLVLDEPANKLYEMWRADINADVFTGGCLAVWDLSKVYPSEGRGEQCSSADAAGFPIAPLLFNADEVAAGDVPHAVRFILPNARIRQGEYVHPATHGTRMTTGPHDAPPYGTRLRLRKDYPLDTLPNQGARTVAKALQKYGMLLADGGNIALTAQSDRHTKAKWTGLLESRDLANIKPKDFDVVELGTPIKLTLDCVRRQ